MGLLKSIMLHDARLRIRENDEEYKHRDQDVSQNQSWDGDLDDLKCWVKLPITVC